MGDWGWPGCSRYPIDVDGSLSVQPGSCLQCPIDFTVPTPTYHLPMTINLIGERNTNNRMQQFHITEFVLPMINRIWNAAGINIYIKCIRSVDMKFIDTNARTCYEGIFHRQFLTDQDAKFNVFVVPEIEPGKAAYTPYLTKPDGTSTGQNYIVIAEIRGDSGEFRDLGRFALVLAHEIGHALGIVNHNKEPSYLMYYKELIKGDPPLGTEDKLTPEEIKTAREYAATPIIPWPFNINNRTNPWIVVIDN
jgi:hypothetical protein